MPGEIWLFWFYYGVTYTGLILAQIDDGPLKWADGTYPMQISKF